MGNTVQYKLKDRHPRVIEPHTRTSTAQRSIASASPVSVSFVQVKMDPEEMRRSSARVMNLQQVVTHAFEGSLAALSLHAEMAPDRLRSLLEMHMPFSAEIAEHLEKCLNLPGGWLDNKRTAIDVDHLRGMVFPSTGTHTDASDDESLAPIKYGTVPVERDAVQAALDMIAADEAAAAAAAVAPVAATHESKSGCGPSVHVGLSDEQLAEQAVTPTATTSFATMPATLAVTDAIAPATEIGACSINQGSDMQARAAAHESKPASTEPAATSEKTSEQESKPARGHDQVSQTLVWLNGELGRYRGSRGGPVRAELAEIMGRAPSTISTWLTGVRKMPDDLLVPLVLAIHKINLPIASEFQDRMAVAAPVVMRNLPYIPAKRLQQTQACAAPIASTAPSAPSAPTTAVAAAEAMVTESSAPSAEPAGQVAQPMAQPGRQETQGWAQERVQGDQGSQGGTVDADKSAKPSLRYDLDLMSPDEGYNSQEFKVTVARAADRIASVLQRLLDR